MTMEGLSFFEGPSPFLANENHEDLQGFLERFACAIFVIADLGFKTKRT